jgi:CIC family chloride channel protein
MANTGSMAGLPERSSARRHPVERRRHEDKVLLVLTLIIGAVVGLVVVLFILLTENLGARLYPASGAAWRRVLIPLFGALLTGFLLQRYFPNARGSGIPQTKAALFLRDGYISFRTVLGKFGLCSVSLASGIALGREGPSVHVGAGIASVLGRRLRLSPASIKALVPAGAAAALAAAFNTPISAVLFSLEEVMGDMHAPVLGSVVLSSATSWIVLHLILGDEPLFHAPAYQLVHPVEFVFYAALGVIGGLVSVGFVKFLLWQRKYFLRAPKSIQWLLPAVGGLTVGLIGWRFPEVLGVGYAFVGKALNGQMLVGAMALLVLLKLLATSTCYASGNAGGIFGPSLFMGAMMGGAVGGVAHLAMPDYTGSVGAYALVGMGAAFAGIVRVPLTSVIMIFEITRDYAIIVPLMIANLISYFISSRLQEEPIYEALQHQDGIHLPSGARARERLLIVGDAYRPEAQALPAAARIGQAVALVDRERGAWPVVDEGGFRGMVNLEQLDEAVRNGRGDSSVAELAAESGGPEAAAFPGVYPDDPLELAMHWLAAGEVKVLPVLSRTNIRDLKGTISLADGLAAYAGGGSVEEAYEASEPVSLPTAMLSGALAALVAVVMVAGFLNYFYRAERGKKAEQAYEAANELLQKDRLQEAIAQYRNALSISHSVEHRLALALALVKAGQMNEATIYLTEILRQRPASGPANLALAQALAAESRVDDAVIHYQRAILGSWPDQPVQRRTESRMQLVEYLGKAGRQAQARAELLALVAGLPTDPALQKRAGRMLIDFGLPREAAELFRGLLKRGPPDSAEYDGLGDAAFLTGDYQAARDAFRKAQQIDPANPMAARRADLCDSILALDPAQRGLGSRERFRRSQEILRYVTAQLAACAGPESSLPAPSKDALAAARASLARKRAPASFSDAAEANSALAGKLWKQRNASCAAPPADDPMRLVMSILAAR